MYLTYLKNIVHHPVPQHGHLTKQTWKRSTVETVIVPFSHLNEITKNMSSYDNYSMETRLLTITTLTTTTTTKVVQVLLYLLPVRGSAGLG